MSSEKRDSLENKETVSMGDFKTQALITAYSKRNNLRSKDQIQSSDNETSLLRQQIRKKSKKKRAQLASQGYNYQNETFTSHQRKRENEEHLFK